jgi:hypothetical protein
MSSGDLVSSMLGNAFDLVCTVAALRKCVASGRLPNLEDIVTALVYAHTCAHTHMS